MQLYSKAFLSVVVEAIVEILMKVNILLWLWLVLVLAVVQKQELNCHPGGPGRLHTRVAFCSNNLLNRDDWER